VPKKKKYYFAQAKMTVKKKPGFISKLLLVINGIFCLALLIGYLAQFTANGIIGLFGLAYPPLLVANLLFVLLWMLRRRWYFVLSLGCILIGWHILTNNIGFHTSSDDVARPKGNTIRMMTYNVHGFKHYGVRHDTSTKHEILELLKQQQPDIIGFQEFYSRPAGRFAMVDSLKIALKTDHYYFEPFTFHKTVGLAIFSKYPIVAQGMIQISGPKNENQCLYVDIKKDEKIFRIYSVHLQSINFDPEDYNYIDSVSSKGKGADMESARHLKYKLVSAFAKRSVQVLKIKADADKCPYPYIISGDFNDTPSSFAVNQMAKGLKNAFSEKGSGLGKTYNGDFPNYQIDYIMASPQFDVASYKIIEKKLSDHYPVRSDLVLK
jgi:endonuclease/exonuclease/phosphatase family metal-dependent hydrolase